MEGVPVTEADLPLPLKVAEGGDSHAEVAQLLKVLPPPSGTLWLQLHLQLWSMLWLWVIAESLCMWMIPVIFDWKGVAVSIFGFVSSQLG